jgi:hypothetical protein
MHIAETLGLVEVFTYEVLSVWDAILVEKKTKGITWGKPGVHEVSSLFSFLPISSPCLHLWHRNELPQVVIYRWINIVFYLIWVEPYYQKHPIVTKYFLYRKTFFWNKIKQEKLNKQRVMKKQQTNLSYWINPKNKTNSF